MVGNDAIFKCSIPSFVTDFVFVNSWIDSEGNDLGANGAGIFRHIFILTQVANVNSVKDYLLTLALASVTIGLVINVLKCLKTNNLPGYNHLIIESSKDFNFFETFSCSPRV